MWPLVGLGVFYFWLKGHWFARILAFIFLVPTIVVCAGKSMSPVDWPYAAAFLISAVVISWLISGLPIYFMAWRLRAGWAAPSSRELAVRAK